MDAVYREPPERVMERLERGAFSSPVAGKAVHAAFDGGRLTSDAGVVVLAEIERRLGIAERLARCLADPRAPERVHHTIAPELVAAE
jgi:Transposase DDE domain group 1